MIIRKPKTQPTNPSKKILPPYTKKAGKEKTTEFQKYTDPTHLTLYKQVQKLK
jgi:hypothetical protein